MQVEAHFRQRRALPEGTPPLTAAFVQSLGRQRQRHERRRHLVLPLLPPATQVPFASPLHTTIVSIRTMCTRLEASLDASLDAHRAEVALRHPTQEEPYASYAPQQQQQPPLMPPPLQKRQQQHAPLGAAARRQQRGSGGGASSRRRAICTLDDGPHGVAAASRSRISA